MENRKEHGPDEYAEEVEYECNRLPLVLGYLKMRDHAKELEAALRLANAPEDPTLFPTGKTGKDWEKLENERDEAMRQNACIPRSGLALGSLLVKHGILDVEAIEDPEGYDGGKTLAALYDAHMEMVSENGSEQLTQAKTTQKPPL